MQLKETKEQGCLIIEIAGRLDVTNSGIIEKKFNDVVEAGEKKIIIDCGNLEYISSSGLRAFLLLVKKVKTIDGILFLMDLQPDIKEVFDISGFSSIFNIVNSKQDAINGMA